MRRREMEEKLKIAVFIDFDNIEIGVKSTLQREFDVAAVLDALKERGEIVTKIAWYYLHERVWAVVPFGRRTT